MGACPCGNKKSYNECCKPYIEGDANAPTAEALMRSRYSAYVKQKIDYIAATHSPKTNKRFSLEKTTKWSKESKWLGLEIISTEEGMEGDRTGIVEFNARYEQDGTEYSHHEVSKFTKEEERWYYVDGKIRGETHVRETPKIGRNAPCPCGSGKKFKKCCGR
jgi:SEC-C motif-containing protein